MKILVTGACGFVGKNLCLALSRMEGTEVLPIDVSNTAEDLAQAVKACDFAFHLAGVNRPENPADFVTGNVTFTTRLLAALAARGGVPLLLSSSVQAALDNPYGRSKKAAEDAVFAYGAATGAGVFVYRFANVFGKWCRPNYNSAVATWCHNVARDLPIQVRDPAAELTLVYIDDVVDAMLAAMSRGLAGERPAPAPLSVTPAYTRTLGEIVELIRSFRREPDTLSVPDQGDPFAKKLYATYLSALPEDAFAYPLAMHADARGSFTEILRSSDRGQVSVNISRPGITKGQHWHHTKHEKFCVVRGTGLIRFRSMAGGDRVIEYPVSGEKLEVVRIPPGYTHSIVNTGDVEMVTVMWANEPFDPARPDTYFEEVSK